jgi:hypothetical protein
MPVIHLSPEEQLAGVDKTGALPSTSSQRRQHALLARICSLASQRRLDRLNDGFVLGFRVGREAPDHCSLPIDQEFLEIPVKIDFRVILSRVFRYARSSDSNPLYCGVSPHLDATVTISNTLST